jgi:hypothetical protein
MDKQGESFSRNFVGNLYKCSIVDCVFRLFKIRYSNALLLHNKVPRIMIDL